MSLLRAALGGRGARRDQFYTEGVPSLSSMPWAYGGDSIGQDEAIHIAAIYSCVSLLADTVSTLPTHTYDRQGTTRVPLDDPEWMVHPLPLDPSTTWIDHLSQLMWSDCLDGNMFTLALPDVKNAVDLYVLNPTKVVIRKRATYELSMDGGGHEEVGPDQMIHIPHSRRPGDYRGMSPVQEAGTTFAMKKAAEKFTQRVFNQGIFLSGQLLLPGPASLDTMTQLRDEITTQYAGVANAGKPGIFANGAKWDIPQRNFQEMQLVELHKMAKLEAAGLYRVPPYLIGVTDPGAMAYASVEAQSIDFEKYTIRSYVERIEAGYDRLVPGSTSFMKINTNGLLRGDVKSRAEAAQFWVQNKILRPSEIRATEDFPPDPEMPGYLETPNNNAPGVPA